MDTTKRFSLARESYILLAICLLDLILTMWLVSTERASEGNPIMAFYLKRGWVTLVSMKLILVILPLFIAEWGRMHRPRFVQRVLRAAIITYLAIYSIAFMGKDMLASDSMPSLPPAINTAVSGDPVR